MDINLTATSVITDAELDPAIELLKEDCAYMNEYSTDSLRDDKKLNNMSWKLSSQLLHHDPNCSGEFDPYVIIILSQL